MTPSAVPPAPGESAVNAPHPEDEDPADFFGEDGEGGAEERSLMPEDDENAAGEEAAGEEAAGEPGEEQAAGEAAEAAADAATEEEAATEDPPPADVPGDGAQTAPSADRAPAPAAGEALAGQQFSEDGETQREVDEKGGARPSDAGSGSKEPAEAAVAKNGPRGYVVIREIALDKKFLEFFAKQLEDGKGPHTVYMVLEPKVEARNPAPVLTNAFRKHFKRLGQPLRLAAIPLSMFNVRTLSIKPKVIDENIAIED
jgi:hypothetical protein